jgi:4-hydroxy-3-polyprenylbenzoate decarboxylase
MNPYVVGISGASGMVLARRAVDLLAERGHAVIVTASQNARRVWRQETDEPFEEAVSRWKAAGVRYYQPFEFDAPIASGSYPIAGMLVLPCSVGTVGAIASGLSTNLLQRAADCAIKERRRLVLVPRETPLSAIHLENMLKLSRIGVRIVLPVPAFYTRPVTLDDVVDQIVGRALEALGVPNSLDPRFVYSGPDEQGGES